MNAHLPPVIEQRYEPSAGAFPWWLVVVVLVLGAWRAATPGVMLPSVLGAVAFSYLCAHLLIHHAEWLLAILVVGQPFLLSGFAFLGGASRETPMGLALIGLGAGTGLFLLMRAAVVGPTTRQPVPSAGRFASLTRVVTSSAVALGVLLFAGLLYGHPNAPASSYALKKALGYAVFNLIPFVLCIQACRSEEKLRSLVRALAILGTVSAGLTLLSAWLHFGGIPGFGLGGGKETYGTFAGLRLDGRMWFGRRVTIAMLSALLWGYWSHRAWGRRAAYLLSAALMFIIFLAARGPFVSALPGVLVFAYLLGSSVSGRRSGALLTAAGALAMLSGVVYLLPSLAPSGVVHRYTELGNAEEIAEEHGTRRLLYYKIAWDSFLANPAFGVGTGNWKQELRKVVGPPDPNRQSTRAVYPHNLFFEVGCELGLCGLTALGALLVSAFVLGRRLMSALPTGSTGATLAAWGLSLLFVTLLNAMFSGDIHRNDHVWFAAAVLVAIARATGDTADDG